MLKGLIILILLAFLLSVPTPVLAIAVAEKDIVTPDPSLDFVRWRTNISVDFIDASGEIDEHLIVDNKYTIQRKCENINRPTAIETRKEINLYRLEIEHMVNNMIWVNCDGDIILFAVENILNKGGENIVHLVIERH